ncbi:MAG: HD domain-containing protein [Acidimicrobiales bacterium]|nr:HD domain-containing protein [Acidimicrobiales bacterium]
MTTTLEHPRPGIANDLSARQWQRRSVLALLLRTAIVLTPLAVAIVLGLIAGSSIDGDGISAELVRVGVAGAVSILAFVLMERLGRRFLPLAMLLKLTLVFPDHAPSRFAVALRSTSVKKLQEWARATQHDDGPAALIEKVVTLAAALNTHDRRTRGHSDRSRAMAELIAVEMGLPETEVNEVRWGAFLHDIGKILVPASLLNKPGKPTPSEWETLKRHPADGGDLVEPLRGFLGSGVEAVSGHHENFDGSGYPRGLAGADIALSARIVSVADSFEVMTAVRSYTRPMKVTEARKELARYSGSQFDPAVVRALFNVSLGRLHWSMGLAAWAAELPFLGVIPRASAQAAAFVAGPTVSVSTLSGVAAITLGSMVIQTPMSTVPANATVTPTSAVVAQAPDHSIVPGVSTTGSPRPQAPGAPTDGTPGTPSAAATPAAHTAGIANGGSLATNLPPNESPQATSHTLPPQATGDTLPPQANSQATDPTLPPQANSQATDPTLPPQATSHTLPPQAANPHQP